MLKSVFNFVGGVLMVWTIVCAVLLVAWLLAKIWKVIAKVQVFRTIAGGGERLQEQTFSQPDLFLYVVPVKLMDETLSEEVFNFCKVWLNTSKPSTLEIFLTVARKYKYVFLYRDRWGGSLRGMFLLDVSRHNDDGDCYTVYRTGLAYFQNHYRGGPFLYVAMQYFFIQELIFHPRTPIYLLGKAFSYMSYLTLVKHFKNSYPRHDCPVIPAKEKKIMDDFGMAYANAGDTYDPSTCVIQREMTTVKSTLLPTAGPILDDPDVKHFIKLNPDWQKGHCLVIVGRITWWDILGLFAMTMKKLLRPSKRKARTTAGGSDKPHPGSRSKEFMSEAEYRRFSFIADDVNLDGFFEEHPSTPSSPTSPSAEEKLAKKRTSYVRTRSMAAGVDRIDPYSEVDLGSLS